MGSSTFYLFQPGWIEISRIRFTAEFLGGVALQDSLLRTLVYITGLLASTTIYICIQGRIVSTIYDV